MYTHVFKMSILLALPLPCPPEPLVLHLHFPMHLSIPGVLARHNKHNGRSIGSRIDLEVYCPPDVLQVSGPLYGDTGGIQDAYNSFMSNRLASVKLSMCKCTTCGYPDCGCTTCDRINRSRYTNAKTKASGPHTCALKHVISKGGAPPAKGHYDADMNSQLKSAWVDKGIHQAPVFSKHRGSSSSSKQNTISGYFWPEELEGLTCKVRLVCLLHDIYIYSYIIMYRYTIPLRTSDTSPTGVEAWRPIIFQIQIN